MGIFTKNINPRAYQAPLKCPHPHPQRPTLESCGNTKKWKLDRQRSTPWRERYVCGKCGKGVVYDISNNINPELLRIRK